MFYTSNLLYLFDFESNLRMEELFDPSHSLTQTINDARLKNVKILS